MNNESFIKGVYLGQQIKGWGSIASGGGSDYTNFWPNILAAGLLSGEIIDSAGSISYISSYVFAWNDITLASFPNCESLYSGAFASCWKLSTVIFNNLKTIDEYAFYRCYSLISVYLLSTSMCHLKSIYNLPFIDTPIATDRYIGSYGTIYVPSELLSNYISDRYWSYYSSRFSAFSGFESSSNS